MMHFAMSDRGLHGFPTSNKRDSRLIRILKIYILGQKDKGEMVLGAKQLGYGGEMTRGKRLGAKLLGVKCLVTITFTALESLVRSSNHLSYPGGPNSPPPPPNLHPPSTYCF